MLAHGNAEPGFLSGTQCVLPPHTTRMGRTASGHCLSLEPGSRHNLILPDIRWLHYTAPPHARIQRRQGRARKGGALGIVHDVWFLAFSSSGQERAGAGQGTGQDRTGAGAQFSHGTLAFVNCVNWGHQAKRTAPHMVYGAFTIRPLVSFSADYACTTKTKGAAFPLF